MVITLQMGYNQVTRIRWPGERSNVPRPWPKGVDPLDAANSTIPLSDKDIARFWSKVDRSAGPDGCWPWTGRCDRKGYGRFQLARRDHRTQRVALAIDGRDPGPLYGCHHCDSPSCCNPAHLYAGTQFDNMRDCVSRGRHVAPRGEANGARTKPWRLARGDDNGARRHPEALARGEANGNSRLTAVKVCAIRERAAAGCAQRDLAQEFGVGYSTVQDVVARRSWKSIATEVEDGNAL